MFIDTHCHLNHEQFDNDWREAAERANAAGIAGMIVVGYDIESSHLAVDRANECDFLYTSVGIHPHDASSWNKECENPLREWSRLEKVCAIGEIGLDYYRDLSPRDAQERAFRAQLQIAREVALPVIIHCRDAYEDTLRILEQERISEIGGVMHCWAGNVAEAHRAVDLGMYLGFGGTSTYKNADIVREAAQSVPLDAIILETDSPYLSPVPHRGKRNEPAYIPLIAAQIAQARATSTLEIEAATTSNALRCFPRLTRHLSCAS